MGQTKTMSLVEQLTRFLVNYIVATIINLWLLPWMFDISITLTESMGVTMVFAIMGITNGYIVRRCFNKL